MYLVLEQSLVPVILEPAELEDVEVVEEPRDKPVETGHVHDSNPLVLQLSDLCQHLRHGAGL